MGLILTAEDKSSHSSRKMGGGQDGQKETAGIRWNAAKFVILGNVLCLHLCITSVSYNFCLFLHHCACGEGQTGPV